MRGFPVDQEIEEIRARKRAQLEQELKKAEPALPVTLSDANFWEFVKSNRVVLVDFWAAWCPPCRAVAPTVEALAKDYAGRVTVGKLNTDENPGTASSFGIHSIPTLLVFKDGKAVDTVIGAVPRPFLEKTLQRWL